MAKKSAKKSNENNSKTKSKSTSTVDTSDSSYQVDEVDNVSKERIEFKSGRKSNFYFKDSQKFFNHDFRMFIFGAEVTAHTRGGITVTRPDRNGPGTMSFDLDNVHDIFTLTAENKGYEKEYNYGTNEYEYKKSSNTKYVDVTDAIPKAAAKALDNIAAKITKDTEEITKLQSKLDDANTYLQKYTDVVNSLQESLKGNTDKTSVKEIKSLLREDNAEKTKYQNQVTSLTKQIFVLQKDINSSTTKKNIVLNNFSKENGRYKISANFNSSANYSVQEDKLNSSINKLLNNQVLKTYTYKELFHDNVYSDAAKQLVYINKSILNADIVLSKYIKVDFTSGFKPYPLAIESCIFEKNDPVRFFIRDPSSPFTEDKWAPMFTGFIQNITEHTDYVNGERFFTVSCYDIRGIMQKQRVLTNPRWEVGTDTQRQKSEMRTGDGSYVGYMGDVIADGGKGGEAGTKYGHSGVGQVLLDLSTGRVHSYKDFKKDFIGKTVSTLSNAVYNNTAYLTAVNSETSSEGTKPSKNGIGCFLPGFVLNCPYYWEDKKNKKINQDHIDAMELWYDILVFGTKADYLTSDEVYKIGSATIPYGEFDPYNGFLHLLIPRNGLNASSIFSSQLDSINSDFQFSTRYEMFNKAVEALDYQWFCNAMGDIVVEFPMYDFLPNSFGAYADQLRVNNHLISGTVNEVVDDIVTGVAATGGITRPETQVQKVIDFVHTAYAWCDALAFKYGVNIEELTVPTMLESASTSPLLNQAVLELIKRNILSSSMEMEIAFRWAIFPNKPMLNVERCRMGIVGSFSFTFQVNESVSSTVDLRFIRKMREDNSFINIFNGTGAPIEYTDKSGNNTVRLGETGINVLYTDKSN